MPIARIALVGHCGFDAGPLSRFAKEVAPHARVVCVNEQAELDDLMGSNTLLLVNRVLDGRFDVGSSGIELIREVAAQADWIPAMLISNYEDAQQQAQEAGALPGFGKSQIANAAVRQRITDAIKSR